MNFAVNYVAVIAAAVAAFVIGAIWYAPPVFGRRWAAYLGKTPEQMGQPGPGFALAIAASIVNAWVLAVLAMSLGAKTVPDGVILGVIAWLGFMATITVVQVAFEGRSWGLWIMNNAHNLLVQGAMGAIVAVLR